MDDDTERAPEEEADHFINDLIGAEYEKLGDISDYSFENDDIKFLAEKYFEALAMTKDNVAGMLNGDEEALEKYDAGTNQRQETVKQLMDEYGLKFDKRYEEDVEVFFGMSGSVKSTNESGFEIEEKMKGLDLSVVSAGAQPFENGSLLFAEVANNTDKDIKDVGVLFVAWDENDLPLRINPQNEYGKYYVIQLSNEGANIVAGSSGGTNAAIPIEIPTDKIKRIGAIVNMAEFYDGSTFENPYTEEWVETYAEKKYEGEK